MDPIAQDSTPNQLSPDQLTPPTIQPAPKPSILPIVIFIFLIISLAGVGALTYQNTRLQQQITAIKLQPIAKPTPTPTSDPTGNWKTFTGIKYSFRYPEGWIKENTSAEIALKSPNENMTLSLSLGLTGFGFECEQKLKEESLNLGGAIVQKTTLAGVNNEICGDTSKTRSIVLSIKDGDRVDTLFFSYSSGGISQAEKVFDQILSTFTFTDQKNVFCGGIAGKSCPAGYTCKLDGSYPDAGGTCISSQNEGVLKATVIKSPTCPDAQQPGEICEAPVTNETFNIFRVESTQTIQPKTKQDIRDSTEGLVKKQAVTTDATGQFTVSLEAGSYQIRNTVTGIGKDIGNRDFTIVAGQTTTQRFTIDTGIR